MSAKNQAAAILVLVVLVVAMGLPLLLFLTYVNTPSSNEPPSSEFISPEFEWNAEIGDTLTFLVRVQGPSQVYFELNNTLMTVEINALPDLSNEWNASEFISKVIEFNKTSIVFPVVHQNGTEVNSTSSESINEMISRCILPTGGWSALDQFYSDQSDPSDYSFVCNTHYSFIEYYLFVIGYMRFVHDIGSGWEGQVYQNSGVPQKVWIWHHNFIFPYLSYDVTLLLRPY